MSIEAAIAENTAALNRVAALLEESNKGREAALAKLEKQVGTNPTPAAAPADDKPARGRGRPPKEDAAPKEKTPEPVAEKKAEAPVYPSQDEVREAAVAFMGVGDDEKQARRQFMKDVLAEVTLEGGDKIVNTVPEQRAKVIGWFKAFAAGEKVNFMEDEGDTTASSDDDDDIG